MDIKKVLTTVVDQPMFPTGDKYKYQTFITSEAVSLIYTFSVTSMYGRI
jgi:hypothetical protein